MKDCIPLTLGLDLKQTPDNHWAVIEVNGENSGYKGLEKLRGKPVVHKRLESQFRALLASGQMSEICVNGYGNRIHQDFSRLAIIIPDSLLEVSAHHYFLFETCLYLESKEVKEARDQKVRSYIQEWWTENEQKVRSIWKKIKNEDFFIQDVNDFFVYFGITDHGIHPEIGLFFKTYPFENEEIKSMAVSLMNFIFQRESPNFPQTLVYCGADVHQSGTLWLHPSMFVVRNASYIEESIMRNSESVEALTLDKRAQKFFIPQEYRVPFYGNDNEQFMHDAMASHLVNFDTHPYLVAKDPCSSQGRGVDIVPLQEMEELLSRRSDNTLIEPFVPSRSFQHPYSETQHDGCMRIILDVIIDVKKRRITELVFCDGYVRLSPGPLDSSSPLDQKLKANLSGKNPAIPILMSEEQLSRTQDIGCEIAERLIGV